MKFFRPIIASSVAFVCCGVFGFASMPAAPRSEVQSLRWKDAVIPISVSTSLTSASSSIKTNSDVIGALSRSLEAWSNAANIKFQVRFSDSQNVSPRGHKGDGVSLITIAPSAENLLMFEQDPLGEAAKTRIFYNKRGFITEADIVLNPIQQFSTDGTYGTYDLEWTFTHEIGHLLGLGHSSVLGSLMSEKIVPNGLQTWTDTTSVFLTASDISAIRDLYGFVGDECCSVVSGRLLLQSGKAAGRTIVWVEDRLTGRVVGQTETSAGGYYRIGGLDFREYSLYWTRDARALTPASGYLGSVWASKRETRVPSQKLNTIRSGILLSHIGVGMQLGDSAVVLRPGGETRIILGGKNLDANLVRLGFNTSYLRVETGSLRAEDFGDGTEALSFILNVDEETPEGTYSIYAYDSEGGFTAMIGAISVRASSDK